MSRTSRVPMVARTPGAPLAVAIVGRMRDLGMSQATLSMRVEALGVNQSQVSRLLTGTTRDPSMTTLLALCRALRLDPTALARRASLWGTGEAFGDEDKGR